MEEALVFREMVQIDYQALLDIWTITPGLTMRKADTHEGFSRFLKRNPGLSFVVETRGKVIGGILGGHDGRFGSIHHLVVLPEYRKQGIGKHLVRLCLKRIEATGVEKCHIFINRDNESGFHFWKTENWIERTDLKMASFVFDEETHDSPIKQS